ncbi:Sec-independent protein translocase protein TatB [Moorena sp. SIO3E8]|uniref:Sec-independent protein translocase protein TatB n=1 Tax=Moorena sp. SIO3E8 TaxID=2607830 RepID=UPI00141860B7|nr:Sec-independent protein translocase protein TatB [Moorena sp. SIO3E8]NEO17798.1 twin-arginine translocase subunit TatB [Moorena sp. SIO3E8]
MFDIGWSEMMIVAVLALLVIGPKELPRTMRQVAHWFGKAKSLAREFQSGLDDIVREADLEDARKALNTTRNFSPNKMLSDAIDPTGSVTDEIKDVEKTAKSAPESSGSDSASNEEGAAQATIVKQPANIAPAHSLTPPAEGTDSSTVAEVAKPDDPSKQSA